MLVAVLVRRLFGIWFKHFTNISDLKKVLKTEILNRKSECNVPLIPASISLLTNIMIKSTVKEIKLHQPYKEKNMLERVPAKMKE